MKHHRPLKKQGGMLLLEGLIAILIFSFGILAIVGLQSSTLKFASDAKHRVDASFLANQTIGLMWAKRADLASFVVTNQAVSGLPDGKRTIAVTGKEVTVTITWKMPGEAAAHKYVIKTQING